MLKKCFITVHNTRKKYMNGPVVTWDWSHWMKYHTSVVHFAWLPTAMSMVRELALTLSCHVAANIVLHNVSLATCACAQRHRLLLCWHNAQMLPCCNHSRFMLSIIDSSLHAPPPPPPSQKRFDKTAAQRLNLVGFFWQLHVADYPTPVFKITAFINLVIENWNKYHRIMI